MNPVEIKIVNLQLENNIYAYNFVVSIAYLNLTQKPCSLIIKRMRRPWAKKGCVISKPKKKLCPL